MWNKNQNIINNHKSTPKLSENVIRDVLEYSQGITDPKSHYQIFIMFCVGIKGFPQSHSGHTHNLNPGVRNFTRRV